MSARLCSRRIRRAESIRLDSFDGQSELEGVCATSEEQVVIYLIAVVVVVELSDGAGSARELGEPANDEVADRLARHEAERGIRRPRIDDTRWCRRL